MLLPYADWQTLRTFGQNSILRTSYYWFVFVPIAAKLISQLENPLVINLLGQQHKINLTLPFSWYQFFFAAVSFSAANLLFAWRCPKLVQDFRTPRESYSAGNGAVFLQKQLIELPGHVFDDELQNSLLYTFRAAETATGRQTRTVDSWLEEHGTGATPSAFEVSDIISGNLCEIKREEMGDLFSVIYAAHVESRPISRLATLIGYVAGFYFVGHVLWDNINFVLTQFAAHQK